MNRSELRKLAKVRLKEAQTLLRHGCYDGAYYLAGYAVECALKACIAKKTRRSEFPELDRVRDSYTHKLTTLVRVADLTNLLDSARGTDPAFDANWKIVEVWSEKARYAWYTEQKARNLIRALTDRKHGVMRWIRQYW